MEPPRPHPTPGNRSSIPATVRRACAGVLLTVAVLAGAGCAARDGDRLVEVAEQLRGAEGAEAEELFATAVDLVAAQGAVHSEEVAQALADAARTHFDLLVRGYDALPVCQSHTFLTAMLDAGAAGEVYAAALEHARSQLAAPQGESISGATSQVARSAGLVAAADESADGSEERADLRHGYLDGLNVVVEAVGAPGTGQLDQVVDELAAGGAGDTGAELDTADFRLSVLSWLSVALARFAYDVEELWTSAEVLTTARNEVRGAASEGDVDFFVDGTDGDRRPIKAHAEMSEDEAAAYQAWVNSDPVQDVIVPDRTNAGSEMSAMVESGQNCA